MVVSPPPQNNFESQTAYDNIAQETIIEFCPPHNFANGPPPYPRYGLGNKHFSCFPACGRVQWDTNQHIGISNFCCMHQLKYNSHTLYFPICLLVYYIFSPFPLIYQVSVLSIDCICYVQYFAPATSYSTNVLLQVYILILHKFYSTCTVHTVIVFELAFVHCESGTLSNEPLPRGILTSCCAQYLCRPDSALLIALLHSLQKHLQILNL